MCSCDQAALWMVQSVPLSVCLFVCHTFFQRSLFLTVPCGFSPKGLDLSHLFPKMSLFFNSYLWLLSKGLRYVSITPFNLLKMFPSNSQSTLSRFQWHLITSPETSFTNTLHLNQCMDKWLYHIVLCGDAIIHQNCSLTLLLHGFNLLM